MALITSDRLHAQMPHAVPAMLPRALRPSAVVVDAAAAYTSQLLEKTISPPTSPSAAAAASGKVRADADSTAKRAHAHAHMRARTRTHRRMHQCTTRTFYLYA